MGGFSGKGIFATLSYLVVEFDGGQKVCNFKYEQQVDEFLSVIQAEHPSIPCVSAAAEQRIAEEKAAGRKKSAIVRDERTGGENRAGTSITQSTIWSAVLS